MLRTLTDTLESLGRYFVFLGEILLSVPKKPSRFAQCMDEIERIGVHSIQIILLSDRKSVV